MGSDRRVKSITQLADNSQKDRKWREYIPAGQIPVIDASIGVYNKNTVIVNGGGCGSNIEGVIGVKVCIQHNNADLHQDQDKRTPEKRGGVPQALPGFREKWEGRPSKTKYAVSRCANQDTSDGQHDTVQWDMKISRWKDQQFGHRKKKQVAGKKTFTQRITVFFPQKSDTCTGRRQDKPEKGK